MLERCELKVSRTVLRREGASDRVFLVDKLECQASTLALKLEDLKERRQKYRTLVESDLETLLEKRGY